MPGSVPGSMNETEPVRPTRLQPSPSAPAIAASPPAGQARIRGRRGLPQAGAGGVKRRVHAGELRDIRVIGEPEVIDRKSRDDVVPAGG